MTSLTLVIGNKNYSSWSMRPWLVLRQADIDFKEVRIPLYWPESAAQLTAWSPSGKVPALHDGEIKVWDSLAICEYLAERFPEKQLWPADATARAVARSISAEMHAGFAALREHLSMNVRARYPGAGRTAESLADIARIVTIWTDCRARFGAGGDFLFGRFGIADAMYAPVVLRFRTYGVELAGAARAYADAVLALPAVQEWVADAVAETERIERFERDASL
ncbi:glutathione S-transferase family protein [Thiobacillus sedimenti]|uniref:Glutathione S-transferase family protein n=1 Tax=Thiobacillus sedimenti TaxID=3110231 RepID=A0ABZ1CIN1_9PROT|nr:glutathione S-transferase family protein [Thiobacillus sp. SCUT-2]WRS39112.1 glutathione S-transferase family protein [Thiobacillus sp. SCUT-2]